MHARAVRIAAAAAVLVSLSGGGVIATESGRPSSPTVAPARSRAADRIKALDQATIDFVEAAASPAKASAVSPPALRSPLSVGGAGGTAPDGPSIAAPGDPPIQASTTSSPPIGQPGFDGLARSSVPETATEPPDSYLAVGPEHIMQVVNSFVRVTDRNGTIADEMSLTTFVSAFPLALPTTVAWFDPRIIYDSLHSRWLITVAGLHCNPSPGIEDPETGSLFGDGIIFFATSDTADPTGTWLGSALTASDWLIDYPAPGTSTDKIAFGWNTFEMIDDPIGPTGSCVSPPTYLGGDVVAIDWADWLAAGSYEYENHSTGPEYFTPTVAFQTPATTSRLHVIVEKNVSGSLNPIYQSFTGSVASETFGLESERDLNVPGGIDAFLVPPPPTQPGSDPIADAVDERPTDAIWQNGLMTWVATYPCDPAGGGAETRACVRVSQIDTTGVSASVAPTKTQDFVIAESGTDNFMGGIGMAANGTLHVVWTRSSTTAPSGYPSSYAAYQLPADAADTISPKELLAAGSGTYTGERWGDYVGVAQDPFVPSRAWQSNQHSAGGSEWESTISPLQSEGTTYIPIDPVRVLDTRTGTGLSGKFTASVARTWSVAGVGGIDAAAVAVTGNVTVVNQTAAGYVSVTPNPTNTPATSTINFPLSDARANNVVVSLSSTGTLSAVYKAGSGKQTHLVFDVTGYFLSGDSGATFTPLAPVRVLDTRTGTGLSGVFVNSLPRTLTVAGSNGVPPSATAITGNLTVTQQTKAGYLSVTPNPTATPTTSTLTFPVGDSRANGIFAPLNGAGELSIVYKAGSTPANSAHVILDVTGYFVAGTGGLRFVPMNPARVMDTRSTSVLSGLSGAFASSTPRTLDVVDHWGVPAGADAIAANLTIVNQTAAGFVSVTTTPTTTPSTSTINFPKADARANGLVSSLDTDGDVSMVYKAGGSSTAYSIHLILDLAGYFE